MKQPPYLLDRESGIVVLGALQEVCSHKGWSLLTPHVRTTHVHIVMEAEVRREKAINAFKAYASGALNEPGRNR